MKFFVAHWEKLVLALALLLLLSAVLALLGRAHIPSLAPARQATALGSNVYLMDYATVLARARTNMPPALARNSMEHPFLQYCPQCKGLQPVYSIKCPECGATVDYGTDYDKDDIPNKWEQQYGLNWHGAADATADPDNDGFDNLAEFKRESDPTNPVSPNVVADEYTVNTVCRPLRPIMFRSVQKLGTGNMYSIMCKGKFFSPKDGAKIMNGKEAAYQLGTFTEKKTNIMVRTISKTIDVSELAMRDLVRNESFTMVLNTTNYMTYLEAKVTKKNDNAVTNVVKGSVLPLDAVKNGAKVEALDDQRGICVVKVGTITYEIAVEK